MNPYRTGAGRPDPRDDLAAELRASFAFVIGTMAVLLFASVVGLALS